MTRRECRRLSASDQPCHRAPTTGRRRIYLSICLVALVTASALLAAHPRPHREGGTQLRAGVGNAAPRPILPPRAGTHVRMAARAAPSTAPARASFQLGRASTGEAVDHAGFPIELCQCTVPMIQGVDSRAHFGAGEPHWKDARPIPWEVFSQGEYIGPARTVHVPEYRLRVDDQLEFIYRFTHEESSEPYRLGVGDEVVIESMTAPSLNRGNLNQRTGLVVQPDGTITLPLLGQVVVARRTIDEVRAELQRLSREYYKDPIVITVTPVKTNTRLEDLRATVDGRFGNGGQRQNSPVTPEGTIQLPGVGSVYAQGLTLDELEREIEQRYLALIGPGVEITPVLLQRAPRFVYVVGEVATPGQYLLQQPTTVMSSLAMAGGWNNGGNLREVVVFRRTEDWRLMATRLDLRGALLGQRPCPADEIWLRDSDIVVVPKSPILRMDDFIELVFTRGVYGVVPFQGVSIGFSKLSSI